MLRRVLPLLFGLFLLPLHAGAADTVTVTTRSAGTMTATGQAEYLLQLPPGPADYELSFTSVLPASSIEPNTGGVDLNSWGATEVSLLFRGIRHTWSIPEGMGWVSIASNLGGEDVYRHSMSWPMITGWFGLEGMLSFSVPTGSYPGIFDFSSQDFALSAPPTSLVELRVYQNGDVVGQLTGAAERFEVSIVSAVPEPGMLPALCAGLALLAAFTRRRRRAVPASATAGPA